MNAGDRWLLKDSHVLRLAAVLDHEDLWTGASDYKRLRCPVCSDTYQHVESRQMVPGCDKYEAGWGGRGRPVILPILPPVLTLSPLCFGSHKGETFCFVRVPYANRTGAAA